MISKFRKKTSHHQKPEKKMKKNEIVTFVKCGKSFEREKKTFFVHLFDCFFF